MQQLQSDLDKDTIQASIDICFHLTYFRNFTQNKLGPLQITLYAMCNQFINAIPYQIISKKTYQTCSKIDLQSYSSPYYILNPYQNSVIDQIVIFKIHVPIDQVETGRLKCFIRLQTIDQLSFNQENSQKTLDSIQLNFGSILYLQCFLPCFFQKYGLSLQANLYTHLLSCKHGNLNNIYRHHFYQAIDHLVICYNKLSERVLELEKNISQLQIKDQNKCLLPLYIDMKKYQQYEIIKEFIDKKIFQQKSMKSHKQILNSFISKFIPQMSEKLLILWKRFLKYLNVTLINASKIQFYSKLALQFQKRIQYKVINLCISKQQLTKKLYKSFPQIQQQKNHYHLTTSSVSQKCSFGQNYVAQNALKQNFFQKSNYNQLKKINVSGFQVKYPSIKVCLNKSIKINEKVLFSGIIQPHIIVFVHGLGATSQAFKYFQTFIKYIYSDNIFILNSKCNQNSKELLMQQMGRKLAIQVVQFVSQSQFGQNFSLSFIGHSLGGLIIRSALPHLQTYKFNMRTLITLSTPHLGYFFHNSTVNKLGMWAISKLSTNDVIDYLLMVQQKRQNMDEQTCYKASYLYQLSFMKGMGWFQHVMFCGSQDDYFVSPLSALINTKEQIKKRKDLKSNIWEQMRENIEQQISDCNVYKLLVEFNENVTVNLKDQILGRKSHIMYLSSKDFILYLLLVYKQFFA